MGRKKKDEIEAENQMEEKDELADEIEEVLTEGVEKINNVEPKWNKVLSTGSTLLDLAISGGRIRGGGIPGGVILEIFGPSGAGKTSVLSELASSAQYNGGEANFFDPEARLDKEYARIYQLELDKKNYHRPDTVNQLFDEIWNWKPENNEAINLIAADSLASLSTEMEMESEDKMGMKRAKDFSQGLRKTCRLIANNNWVIACSNQERESQNGLVTPGGKGIPYYSSLRIRIYPALQNKYVSKSKTIDGVKQDKIIGIKSICQVKKSSLDDPFREVPLFIMSKVGIDDIRGNLQWLKEATKNTKYVAVDKEFGTIDTAIKHIEENDLEDVLRENIIDFWEKIENSFKIERKQKKRR